VVNEGSLEVDLSLLLLSAASSFSRTFAASHSEGSLWGNPRWSRERRQVATSLSYDTVTRLSSSSEVAPSATLAVPAPAHCNAARQVTQEENVSSPTHHCSPGDHSRQSAFDVEPASRVVGDSHPHSPGLSRRPELREVTRQPHLPPGIVTAAFIRAVVVDARFRLVVLRRASVRVRVSSRGGQRSQNECLVIVKPPLSSRGWSCLPAFAKIIRAKAGRHVDCEGLRFTPE